MSVAVSSLLHTLHVAPISREYTYVRGLCLTYIRSCGIGRFCVAGMCIARIGNGEWVEGRGWCYIHVYTCTCGHCSKKHVFTFVLTTTNTHHLLHVCTTLAGFDYTSELKHSFRCRPTRVRVPLQTRTTVEFHFNLLGNYNKNGSPLA